MDKGLLLRSTARLAVAEALLGTDATFNREISKRAGVSTGAADRVLKVFAECGWIASRLESIETANKDARPPRRYWRVVDRESLTDFHRGTGAWSGAPAWRVSHAQRLAVDRRALEKERAHLVARIAEIDDMIGTKETET